MIDGLQLPYGVKPTNPVPVDALSGPYEGNTTQEAVSLANSLIPHALRYKSLQVRLIISGESYLYWYKNGVNDNDLVNIGIGNFIPRKIEFTIGDGLETEFILDHNLGTKFVLVQIFETESGENVETSITRIDNNNVKIAFTNAPSENEFSVVII
jgi:hypothetical protein